MVKISQSANTSKAARNERVASIMMMISQVFDDGPRNWLIHSYDPVLQIIRISNCLDPEDQRPGTLKFLLTTRCARFLASGYSQSIILIA